MLKFISFGSGSSGNCYLLYTESDGLLIDAGIGVRTLKSILKIAVCHSQIYIISSLLTTMQITLSP